MPRPDLAALHLQECAHMYVRPLSLSLTLARSLAHGDAYRAQTTCCNKGCCSKACRRATGSPRASVTDRASPNIHPGVCVCVCVSYKQSESVCPCVCLADCACLWHGGLALWLCARV
jgi:hypothetical protein